MVFTSKWTDTLRHTCTIYIQTPNFKLIRHTLTLMHHIYIYTNTQCTHDVSCESVLIAREVHDCKWPIQSGFSVEELNYYVHYKWTLLFVCSLACLLISLPTYERNISQPEKSIFIFTSSDLKACLRWVYFRKRAMGSTLEPVYIMMKKKAPDR